MKKAPNQDLSALFNKLSEKVICVQEYNDREKALMKKNLNLRERAFSAMIDTPHQALNLIKGYAEFIKEADRMVTYYDPAIARSAEKIPASAFYWSAKEMAETEVGVYSDGLNKKFQEKALNCRLQALDECTDHSARVKSGELKLVRPPKNDF
jgi:hypothetical protein